VSILKGFLRILRFCAAVSAALNRLAEETAEKIKNAEPAGPGAELLVESSKMTRAVTIGSKGSNVIFSEYFVELFLQGTLAAAMERKGM
jgi:hypothetical protein